MKSFKLLWVIAVSLAFVAAAKKELLSVDETPKGLERATFAGGCFWCMEPPFHKLPGVVELWSGYTGGQKVNPTYEEVSAGVTGHAEAIEILFDPKKVSYEKLLDIFWRNIDPTDDGGQFVDRGKQYRPGIFYHNEAQKKTAEASRAKLEALKKFKKPIVVELTPFTKFYAAEKYHQHYYEKNPDNYLAYRRGSGRDQFIKEIWGKEALVH